MMQATAMRRSYAAIILCALCAATVVGHYSVTKSFAANGRLMCGERPARASIHLVELDGWLSNDDILSQVFTDAGGYFHAFASTHELSDIEPEVRVYHQCNMDNHTRPSCWRLWKITVPPEYVFDGPLPYKTLTVGHINLEVRIDGEELACSRDYATASRNATDEGTV